MLRAPIWITSATSTTASTCARVHQLGHERQPGLLARLDEDLERHVAEALERVRRGARLERAAAQHRHACGGDRARGLERLLARLDRARAGDEAEVAVADAAAAHLDHGRVGRELARDELVRLEDRQHLLDARRSPRAAAPRAARARRSRRSRSPRGPGVTSARAAGLLEARDDVVDLLGCRGRRP